MPNPRIATSKVKQDPFNAMLRRSDEGEVKLQTDRESLNTKEGIITSTKEDIKEEAQKKTVETLQKDNTYEEMSAINNIEIIKSDNSENMAHNIGAHRGLEEHGQIHGDERELPKDNKDAKEGKGMKELGNNETEVGDNIDPLDTHATTSMDDSGVDCLSLPSVSMDDETPMHAEATLSHPVKYLTRSETYIVPDVLVDLDDLDHSKLDGDHSGLGLDGRADCLQGDGIKNGNDEAGEAMQNNSNNLNSKPRYEVYF